MAEPTSTDIILAAIADLRRHFDEKLTTEIADLRQRVDHKFEIVETRLDGIDKRLDDQNAILAALIPAKIATVGR
jgi:hypothetical protein